MRAWRAVCWCERAAAEDEAEADDDREDDGGGGYERGDADEDVELR